MTTVRLTSNQRDRLLRLGRVSRIPGTSGRWILDTDCGGPAALAHLYRKGYVDRSTTIGPRGGEKLFYRPSQLGWETIERVLAKRAEGVLTSEERAAAGLQSKSEIDTALITARQNGLVVRVYVGETVYFRGVPGQVYRKDDMRAKLMLPIGQREIPLDSITRVTLG